MAEGHSIQEESLEELEREITCGICQEHYTDPKILPCLHYYCKQCVLRLALRTGTGKPFCCPECRCEATLPEGGVDELKTAFFVNRLKTTVSTIERTHGKVEVKCELCEGSSSSAKAFCRQCARFICHECVNLHKRITTFKSHEIASLDDLKHGRAQPIPVKEPPTKKCLDHEEPLTIYCYDCDGLVCLGCTVKDHREHNFEFNKKAVTDEKRKLLVEIKSLKDLHVKLTNAVENIRTAKLDVESQNDSTVNIIKTSFKELRDILDKREKELVEEAGSIIQEKVDKLSVQEKTLSLASAEVQSVVDYTERCVRYCTDNEVMSMHAEMKKTIEHKIEDHSKSWRSLEPVEVADMEVEVRCAEALQQLCQTQAVIRKLPIDPAKCKVHLEETAEIGKIFKGTLITKLSNSQQAKRNCKVSCQMTSLYNRVIADCSVDGDGSGRYSIRYTPIVRGRHELTVLIDGQHVARSPFPVFVSIHPTQLGKPVKVWSGASRPSGITINSEGDLLVTEQSGSIIKFDINGKREKLVTQNKVKEIRCIAVDDEDNIYCIDEVSNKILTCDKNSRNVRVHQVKLEKGVGRRALCIVKNNLLISERGFDGAIMVYDRELNYVRCIQHKGMGAVYGISADVHGNIYVTDRTNSRIQVFSASGVFLRSFGTNLLSGLSSVCVSAQYVYVSGDTIECFTRGDRVSVFTTAGVYVTSFGRYGSKEGQFCAPNYLYFNKNGFLYVCDCGNNRIQCF